MPHRAGYFAFAYQWDHHCHELLQTLRCRFNHMLLELSELEYQQPFDAESLLNYYKKWHYNKEHYYVTINEIGRRQFVIRSLGYRGFGVNRDLEKALDALRNDYAGRVYHLVCQRFWQTIDLAKSTIYLPQERIESMDSNFIIGELCRKLNWDPDGNIPSACRHVSLDLGHYFKVMSQETSWSANTAIFQKLFLGLATSSMTIMKGSRGYQNQLLSRDMKVIGNRNFINLYREIFSNLHNYTDIGLNLLKRIHYVLSRGIDAIVGNFRTFDFSDKNGVTLDYGNFRRELRNLSHVLRETAQSFHNLDTFIYNLSRSYYMFLGIHPFGDSNGRTARCFLNYLFLKKGLPPISFVDEKEIFALPRYGGSMEDMHEYIKAMIMKAVERYFFERWKLENFGFIARNIYNVSFDSGFHFQQIDGHPRQLEVNFNAYLVDNNDLLNRRYQEQSLVVLPSESCIHRMITYSGFSHSHGGKWENVNQVNDNYFVKEISTDTPGGRAFNISTMVELSNELCRYEYFNCCVASPETGRIFNNQGLNYSYRM